MFYTKKILYVVSRERPTIECGLADVQVIECTSHGLGVVEYKLGESLSSPRSPKRVIGLLEVVKNM